MEPCDNGKKGWSSEDLRSFAIFWIVALATATIGLGGTVLWGSEGRWALIANEMYASGDYLTPVINGMPYYDKPLLSYWAILPFAWLSGSVTEWAARMPNALGGVLTAMMAFLVGRRFFGGRVGLMAGLMLMTAGVYLFWTRVAAADLLNAFGVWAILWFFIDGGREGRTGKLVLMYIAAALASFLKGPVAASAAFAAMFFVSGFGVVEAVRGRGGGALKESILREFTWVLSRGAAVGIAAGLVTFAVFLAGPCLLADDWGLARLMWKENVVRFFEPFDHKGPVYTYVEFSFIFMLPWAFFFLISLFDIKSWPRSEGKKTVLLMALGIFLFFTASGSRRSYYILPLMPALAIMTAYSISRWVEGVGLCKAMNVAAALTAAVCLCLGIGVEYMGIKVLDAGGPVTHAAAAAAVILSMAAFVLTVRSLRRPALAAMLLAAVAAELWYFGYGKIEGEKIRPLAVFYKNAAALLKDVPGENIALYDMGRSPSIVLYLERRSLQTIKSADLIGEFLAGHPERYLITKNGSRAGNNVADEVRRAEPVLSQGVSSKAVGESRKEDEFIILRGTAR